MTMPPCVCGLSSIRATVVLKPTFMGIYIGGIIASVLLFGNVNNANALNTERNAAFARSFGVTIAGKVEYNSGYEVMNASYDEREGRREFVIRKKNATEHMRKMANNLGKMLKIKQRAVKRLVDRLEESSKTFDWNASEEVSYYNVEFLNKDPNDVPEEYKSQQQYLNLTKDSRFLDRPINLEKSVVQVPFDVYSSIIEIQRVANWSRILNDEFRRNLIVDPTMKWQYFASTHGLLRVYPGYQWKMKTEYDRPNIYDCRNRNWYTEAATFPKDMLILVDGSGSMKGLKMSIAAHVVKILLETLGDNDFFNVLLYNNSVYYVEPCFNATLVRADDSNKKRVIEAVKHSKTMDVADLSNALRHAFDLMLDFHSSGTGSDCYSSIMIITDGATNSYQAVMQKYMNTTSRQIRIFSYLIGADKAYLEPVRDIACDNDGYFHQVESRNDVSEKVLHYLTIMNRPQAIQEDHHTIWTKPYYDQTYLDLGFGLVSTIAIPVYLHRDWKDPRMLGVAATDVPVSLMLDTMVIHRTGVNGYVFIVTNNGYIAAHPRLQTFFSRLYHGPTIKPNYNSIDIDDLEGTAVNDTIRERILSGAFGNTPDLSEVFVPLDGWKRSISVRGKYYYAPVVGTPFTLAMFLPDGYGELRVEYARSLKVRRKGPTYDEKECDQVNRHLMNNYNSKEIPNRESAVCSLNYSEVSVAEQWLYCRSNNGSVMTSSNGKPMTQLQLIKEYFFKKEGNVDCDKDLLNGVLFDVYSTAGLYTLWAEHSGLKNASNDGIVLVFIVTSSGVMRKYWHMDLSMSYQPVLDMLNGFDRQSFPSFYRRAVAYPERNAYIYTLLSGDNMAGDLLVSRAITRKRGITLGVAGLVMKTGYFANEFWKHINSSTLADCSQNPRSLFTCYVIDDNGVVILSSSDSRNDVGLSIGQVDGQISRHLVANGIFSITNLYDYGTVCKDEAEALNNPGGSAFSRHITNPFRSVLSYITFWTKDLAFLLAKLVIWNFWTAIFSPGGTEASISLFVENSDHYKVCDVRYELLVVNGTMVPYINVTECTDGCTRDVEIEKISQSNLYLIVTENVNTIQCDCTNQTTPLLLKKEEIKYNKEDTCSRLRDHKLRRKSDGCDAHHKTRNEGNLSSLQCSAGTSLHRTRLTFEAKFKGGSASYTFFTLGLSWFLPYIALNLISMAEDLPPFI